MEEQRKMGRPKVADKKKHVGFTLSPKVLEELYNLADKEERSVSQVVQRILAKEFALDPAERDTALPCSPETLEAVKSRAKSMEMELKKAADSMAQGWLTVGDLVAGKE